MSYDDGRIKRQANMKQWTKETRNEPTSEDLTKLCVVHYMARRALHFQNSAARRALSFNWSLEYRAFSCAPRPSKPEMGCTTRGLFQDGQSWF